MALGESSYRSGAAIRIKVTLIAASPAMEPKTPPMPLSARQKVDRTQSKPIQPRPLVATRSAATAQFCALTTPEVDLPPIVATPA